MSDNVTKAATISDTDYNRIISSLATLHGVVKTYKSDKLGEIPTLPDEEETAGNYLELTEKVLSRTFSAVKAYRKARRDEQLSEIKGNLAAVVSAHRAQWEEAHATWSQLPDMVRKMAPMSDSFTVAMSDIVPCFPQGTPETQIVPILKELSYTVGKHEKSYFLRVAGKVEQPSAK